MAGQSVLRTDQTQIYTDWAKRPLDAGPRESIEQIEATGLRYMVTERANNMAVGSWRSVGGGGIAGDFMRPFTKISGTGKLPDAVHVLWKY